ncbi:MAG: MarR family transcriptional regulator [Candidatus Choladocola sp.]|nr:MarR family transcriptional regulator [Candidatus Choladocola sp.]
MSDTYRTINDVLVELINNIWELEGNAVITDEFKDITNNDMHVIEAIGIGKGENMSAVAKKLNITLSSLTTAVNSLVRKAYVERQRSSEDRRIVEIRLTEKGEKAYLHHEEYHNQMIKAAISEMSPEEIPILVKMLKNLKVFFETYGQNKDGN